jgi:hypothetical protein
MRMKTALWAASLTFSLAVAGNGVCFAQSGLANAAEGANAKIAQESPTELVVAAVFPNSMDQADAQTDDAAGSTLENTASEAAEPAPKGPAKSSYSKVGIGLKLSTLGAGIEVATPLARKINVRGGFNMFRYDRGITNNGIHYTGQLQFQSAEAHLDLFPFGGFHISPGLLFYNGNQVTATAAVPGGQSFTVGGTPYISDAADPVTGTGKLDFVKVSPSIMLGIGNLIPRNGRHYSFLFEVGGAYQGSARVALNFTGSVCDPITGLLCRTISSDPTVQANILSEQNKISKDVNPYRFFPVISLGVGFNF